MDNNGYMRVHNDGTQGDGGGRGGGGNWDVTVEILMDDDEGYVSNAKDIYYNYYIWIVPALIEIQRHDMDACLNQGML